MSNWQPIESAPKTGDPILIYCGEGRIKIGWWIDAGKGYWDDATDWSYDLEEATHWQPLPDPPEGK
jgi:hypothetical protein